MAFADSPATGEVVHPQRGRVSPDHGLINGSSSAEQGNQKREHLDEVRRVLQQETTLFEALPNEAKVMLLEVSQAAVHHLGGLGGRPRSEVSTFHQCGAQASRGRVQGDAGAGNASANNDYVEAFFGKSR
jgi:hypothetical protein